MDKSELLDLIPPYVTGKVSDEEKAAIERELPNSKELRDEIAFWRSARVATRKAAAYSAGGHLTSEQIVDYVREAISNPKEKLVIERHLQACDFCAEDLEIVKPAYEPSRSFFQRVIAQTKTTLKLVGEFFVPPQLPGGKRGLAMVLRPIYALPMLAVLVVSGVIIYQLTSPQEYAVSFALQFQTQDRSSGSGEVPTLTLDKRATVIHMSVPIPHAIIQPTMGNITLTLFPPDEKPIQLTQGLSWSVGSSTFDTAKVEIPASILHTIGTYSLHATVKYTPTSEPFEYSYRFKSLPD